MNSIFMINTGWVIEIVMNLINPWMPKSARDKFVFFNDDSYKERLRELIPEEQIPPEYGGSGRPLLKPKKKKKKKSSLI